MGYGPSQQLRTTRELLAKRQIECTRLYAQVAELEAQVRWFQEQDRLVHERLDAMLDTIRVEKIVGGE